MSTHPDAKVNCWHTHIYMAPEYLKRLFAQFPEPRTKQDNIAFCEEVKKLAIAQGVIDRADLTYSVHFETREYLVFELITERSEL